MLKVVIKKNIFSFEFWFYCF